MSVTGKHYILPEINNHLTSISFENDFKTCSVRFAIRVVNKKSNQTYYARQYVTDEALSSLDINMIVQQIFFYLCKEIINADGCLDDSNYHDIFTYEVKKAAEKLLNPEMNVSVIQHKNTDVSEIARKLPGVQTKVNHPCDCNDRFATQLYSVIIHLNDYHKWSREKIADWVDELHDAGIIDAEFKTPDEIKPVEIKSEKNKPEFNITQEHMYKIYKYYDVDTSKISIQDLIP